MRLHEIQTTPKPPTPEQSRIKGLQQNAERARDTLQAERDRQRQQREAERKKKIQLPASTTLSASV